jgi:predicted ATPase
VRRHAVWQQEGRWVVDTSLEIIQSALPVSIQAIIDRKIEQVEDSDRNLLAAASLQGLEFDSRLAAIASRLGLAETEYRLRRLQSVHSLIVARGENDPGEAVPGQQYAFVHVLYQEALCRLLTPARRAEVALRIAGGLADLHKNDLLRVAAEMAVMYEIGRNFERAAHWFLQAARKAAEVYANHEAGEFCRRAMSAAARLPDEN